MISLEQAHQHIGALPSLPPEEVSLDNALDLVCAEDVYAAAACPSVDSSLKDGYAVVSSDIADASPAHPVTLKVVGALAAGDDSEEFTVAPGTAVKIMTGASIPEGATAVLASEFADAALNVVTISADACVGRNILRRGSDIARNQIILTRGKLLGPAHLGLLAAAGVPTVSCYPRPRVAVAATGSELVLPGEPVTPGKVAASNMVIASAELGAMGIPATKILIRDNLDQLQTQLKRIVQQVDVLITCGGVLDGDKDLTMRAMEQLAMEKIFHRVRIGPGKGACLGRIGKTIVFNLPGGPPSNNVALLLLALPGIRKMMGQSNYLPQRVQAQVAEELYGQKSWTQLVYGKVEYRNGFPIALPLNSLGRLAAMAEADGLIEISEGTSIIRKEEPAKVWLTR